MRGFTLIELLTILGITAILGSVGFISLQGFQAENLLDLTARELLADLRDAQQRSISQDQGAQWGVHLEATVSGADFYQVFSGPDYSGGTILKTVFVPASLKFISPVEGATDNVIFNRVTGESTVAHSIIIALAGNTAVARSITVAASSGGGVSLIIYSGYVQPLDLSVALIPASGTILQGGSLDVAVNVSLLSGISQLSEFSVANLPNGATASFSPVNCSPTCSSLMTINTVPSTPVGASMLPVTVTSGTLQKTLNFTLTMIAPIAPDSPTALSAAVSSGQATLNWQAPAFNGGSALTNYKVYRGLASGGETFYANIGNNLSYTNTGLTNGTTYYYKVSAENSVGEGQQSNEASARPDAYGNNVSGWAWSQNIGWVSFSCSNNNTCGTVNYGVNVNSDTGLLSGYAWSQSIGWISFNQSDLSGCPSGTCEARVNGGLIGSFPKNVTGWAKILSTNGWLRLAGISQDGNAYGVQLSANGDFSGWSWEPEVVGWFHWKDVFYSVKAVLQ